MEPLQQKLDSLLREEQVINCVTCAFCIVSYRRGLTPYQQSDFNTPMGGKKVSPEEESHQDLVWVYHQLPPHDVFNPAKAGSGYYRQLKFDYLNNFWENYDPEQDKKIKFKKTYTPRSYPRTHNDSTKPSTLKAIRKHLADGNHDF